jgi:hypothetical protein
MSPPPHDENRLPHSSRTTPVPEERTSRFQDLLTAMVFYYLTTLIVFFGVEFGYHYVKTCTLHPDHKTRTDVLSCYANWDGRWYQRIATEGYTYDPNSMSSVAFFPLYPLLASGIHHSTGMRSEWALLIVSHLALIASYYLFLRYLRIRRESQGSEKVVQYGFMAMVFFPTTFFFHMTYTESLFLLLLLATLFAIRLEKPLLLIAALIGLATATRPVGVALGPVFVLHLWNVSRSKTDFFLKSLIYGPICLSGLIAYMTYLGWIFSDPFAFAQTQKHWAMQHDITSLGDRLWCLITLQPLTDNFDPENPAYFGRPRNGLVDWLNIRLINVAYFLLAVGMITVGSIKKWLTRDEIILSLFLLLIPLCTNGIVQGLTSHARFIAVIFPIYIVMGRLLYKMGWQGSTLVFCFMAIFLFIYSTQFAAWYWFF